MPSVRWPLVGFPSGNRLVGRVYAVHWLPCWSYWLLLVLLASHEKRAAVLPVVRHPYWPVPGGAPLSVKQSLIDYGRSGTDSPSVRVFPDVAGTPGTPAPGWWNHPVAIMFAAVICAAVFFTSPGLPALSGLLAAVSGVALAALGELNRGRWSTSRAQAVEESVWIADQCGYQVESVGEVLQWRNPNCTALEAADEQPHDSRAAVSLLGARFLVPVSRVEVTSVSRPPDEGHFINAFSVPRRASR